MEQEGALERKSQLTRTYVSVLNFKGNLVGVGQLLGSLDEREQRRARAQRVHVPTTPKPKSGFERQMWGPKMSYIRGVDSQMWPIAPKVEVKEFQVCRLPIPSKADLSMW